MIALTLPKLARRYVERRASSLLAAHRKALSRFEIASAFIVYAETLGLIHKLGAEYLPAAVHPVAAAGTILALIAHLPVIEE